MKMGRDVGVLSLRGAVIRDCQDERIQGFCCFSEKNVFLVSLADVMSEMMFIEHELCLRFWIAVRGGVRSQLS